jgi:betaine-homocysteine S-methyltransferase
MFCKMEQSSSTTSNTQHENRFLKRLAEGPVICAEGYLFELEKRGYLQAGAFVPECVLEHPEVVRQLHRDFVHAGSDVVEALTYYLHREKLRLIGKEDLLEKINKQALIIAREVAQETGALFCGDICNSNIWPDGEVSPQVEAEVRQMFEEQVKWAKEAGVDYIVGETFDHLGEARLACKVIKEAGLPAVITLALPQENKSREGFELEEIFIELEKAGADVVGLNCFRGPATMLPDLERILKAVKIPVAALPVPFRTTPQEPTFVSLTDPGLPQGIQVENGRPFPVALDPLQCTRFEIADFTRKAAAKGVKYFGICCGCQPHHIRAMAEALGRRPPASKYSTDMSKHFCFGTDERLKDYNLVLKDKF